MTNKEIYQKKIVDLLMHCVNIYRTMVPNVSPKEFIKTTNFTAPNIKDQSKMDLLKRARQNIGRLSVTPPDMTEDDYNDFVRQIDELEKELDRISLTHVIENRKDGFIR